SELRSPGSGARAGTARSPGWPCWSGAAAWWSGRRAGVVGRRSRRDLRSQVALAFARQTWFERWSLQRIALVAIREAGKLVGRPVGIAWRGVVGPDRGDLAVGGEEVPLRAADVLVDQRLEVGPLDAQLLTVADHAVDGPLRTLLAHEADPEVGDGVPAPVGAAGLGREVVGAVLAQDRGEALAAGCVARLEVGLDGRHHRLASALVYLVHVRSLGTRPAGSGAVRSSPAP